MAIKNRLSARTKYSLNGEQSEEVPSLADSSWLTSRMRTALIACGLFVIALSGSLITADRTEYNDEELWQKRSQQFATGLVSGDLALLTAYDVDYLSSDFSITMPGIPTLWVGSSAIIAECVTDSQATSLRTCVANSSGPSLPNAHRAMAVVGAALLLVLWLVSRRLLGAPVALLACLLMATEPFLATLRTMFHTDSLVMSLSLIGFVALCRALELVGKERHRMALAALAGASLCGAMLTKLSAAAIVPALAVCVIWAGVRTWQRTPGGPRIRIRRLLRSPTAAVLLVGVGVAAVTASLLWPALIVDTTRQLGALRSSALLADGGHEQFFRGSPTLSPPWYFYLWVLAFRLTPWAFLGLLAVPAAALSRRIDSRWWLFAIFTASQLLIIGMSAKKFDRYGAALLAGTLILVAVSFDLVFGAQTRRWLSHQPIRMVAASGTVAVLALWGHLLVAAGRDFTYFNPVVGGLDTASQELMISWGESTFVADDFFDDRFGEDNYELCDVSRYGIRCPPGDGPRVAATYLANTQRGKHVVPSEFSGSWSAIGSHRIGDVEMIQYWEEK